MFRLLLLSSVAVFFFGAGVQAQNIAAAHDAKGFLEAHQQWLTQSRALRATESSTLKRSFFYLRAGAEGELREEIDNLTEQNPDALRFAMQADCWNPSNFRAGHDRAVLWLSRYDNRPQVETDFVASVKAFLGDAETRRQFVHDRSASTRWLPLLAAGLVLLLAASLDRLLP